MTRFAGQINLHDFFSDNDLSASAAASQGAKSSVRQNEIKAEADTLSKGISTSAQREAADYSAAAAAAIGQAQASATMFKGISDGLSTVASGGIAAYGRANKLGKYAPTTPTTTTTPTVTTPTVGTP